MSLSHNQIKHLTALREKKYRHKFEEFGVEGEKIALEAIAQQRIEVAQIYCAESFFKDNRAAIGLRPTTLASESELKKISSLTAPSSVFLLCKIPQSEPDFAILNKKWFFFCDGIQDPGNLGAIWRLADWFGCEQIFCSETTVDFWNPKTLQASMGAFLRVGAFEMPIDELLKNAPEGCSVLGADMDGSDLFSKEWPVGGILVIGSEGSGLSAASLRTISEKISVPKGAGGGAESLNAAIAGGILMAGLQNGSARNRHFKR